MSGSLKHISKTQLSKTLNSFLRTWAYFLKDKIKSQDKVVPNR